MAEKLLQNPPEQGTWENERVQVIFSLVGVEKAVQEIKLSVAALEKLAPTIKIVVWLGAVLGVSMVGLIWSLITGVATITFR